MNLKNTRSLTLIEFIVGLIIILILPGIFALYFSTMLRLSQEATLRSELTNIRTSIEHYLAITGKLPQDLTVLMEQEVEFKGHDDIINSKKYLEPFRIDKEGQLIDLFGNQYYYDQSQGRVFSQTKGYQCW